MNTRDFDWKPLALVPALALLVLPFIGSPSTWLTLTVAGLAMGMIIFIIASGLTLVFGLMDVLNFGHGVFIALGAFVATSVLGEPIKGSTSSASVGTSASGFQSKSRVFMRGLLLRRQWPHAQTSPRTRRWPHRKTLLIL